MLPFEATFWQKYNTNFTDYTITNIEIEHYDDIRQECYS